MEKKEKKFNIYKILTIVFAVALLVVLGIMGRNWIVQRNAQKEYEKLAAQVNRLQDEANENAIMLPSDTEETEMPVETEETSSEEDSLTMLGIEAPEKNIDWTSLASVNPDIYAWICIPGTKIDYPILQHPTDDSYYLNYNMNGTRGYPGCIYTEKINDKDFTDFDTVVYGHNMRNDSMFATLHNFEDAAFFEQRPYVYIYTGDKVLAYEIFAAYTADDAHILYSNDFSTEKGRQAYLSNIMKNQTNDGNVRQDVSVSTGSHILTLSTCIQGQKNKRFLVQAILVNEDEL